MHGRRNVLPRTGRGVYNNLRLDARARGKENSSQSPGNGSRSERGKFAEKEGKIQSTDGEKRERESQSLGGGEGGFQSRDEQLGCLTLSRAG